MPLTPLQFGPLAFTNPAGLWALAAVPAIIAIHFIQQRFRVVQVSTLFLLDNLAPVDVEGRRLDRIRNSAQLWLQLLLATLIAFLLGAPEWVVPGSVQRIMVVLDSSYSMSAFYPALRTELAKRLDLLSHRADRTEWVLRETDPAAGTLYSGLVRRDFDRELETWIGHPRIGNHPLEPALADSRRLAGPDATMILATDHKQTVPEGIDLLSVGSELDNWGLAGFRINQENGEYIFEALVRNYSKTAGVRSWWFETSTPDGSAAKGEEHPLTLSPQSLTSISGKFPQGVDSLTIALSPDQFPLDDKLPIARPQAKKLAIFGERGELTKPFKKIISSIPDLERTARMAEADLSLLVFSNPADIPSTGRGIAFFTPEPGSTIVVPNEPLVADRNRLVDGLNWSSLVAGKSSPFELAAGDRALVWSGQVPLLIQRHIGSQHLLIVNLDAAGANAFQTPAFIVLLHRFLELLRPEIDRFERGNYELNQGLRLSRLAEEKAGARWFIQFSPAASGAAAAGGARTEMPHFDTPRAPTLPGFFTIFRDDQPAIGGASYFADVVESDFGGFGPADIPSKSALVLSSGRHSIAPFMSLLLLLVGLLLAATWLSSKPLRLRSARAAAPGGSR